MSQGAVLVVQVYGVKHERACGRVKRLVLDTTKVGCPPSENDVCATLLQNILSQFESLGQAFRLSVTQFSFSDLVSKLISEEVRQKDSSRIEEATALHVGRRKENTKFGNKGWNSQRKNDTKVQ